MDTTSNNAGMDTSNNSRMDTTYNTGVMDTTTNNAGMDTMNIDMSITTPNPNIVNDSTINMNMDLPTGFTTIQYRNQGDTIVNQNNELSPSTGNVWQIEEMIYDY